MKKPIKPDLLEKKQNGRVYEKLLQEDDELQKQYNITEDIEKNEAVLRNIFQGCSDIIFRTIKIFGRIKGVIIYMDGLTDMKLLDNVTLKLLMREKMPENVETANNINRVIQEEIAAIGKVDVATSIKETVKDILSGYTGILVEGESNVITIAMKGGKIRNISEPITEVVIRGPRDGFTEDITTNISMVRRRLRSPRLKTESFTMGEISQTKVSIAYIKGIAREEVIEEVKLRLGKIKIDGILESGYIEEFIEDEPYTPFPLVQNTERPDVVSANLLEGKVAIFTDNTPFVLIVPLVFWGQVHSNEDYYDRFTMGTFLRWIRLLYMFLAVLAPSIYVAVTTFHQQMIPPKLLMSIIDNREPTPFPAVIEALLMEITFEALREAGIRLPKPVGQAVSIVGALVIGQAAVEAGLISAPMVIVVSITGIAAFTIPHYGFSFAVRVIRFPMIFLAGSLGLYGITLGVLGILIHIVNLRSFGIPYFSPVAPLNIKRLKDVFVRAPIWSMNIRPGLTGSNNLRVPKGQKPQPNSGNQKQSRGNNKN